METILTFDPLEWEALHTKGKRREQDQGLSFGGAFINSESYGQLLDIVDIYYGLGMKTDSCPYPLQEHCYLLISRDPNKIVKTLGRKVKLQVNRLIHNEAYGVVAATVVLKSNFTCNKTPHIVIAKREGLSHAMISKIINGDMDHKHPSHIKKLHTPYTLHGIIGLLYNSNLEIPEQETPVGHVAKDDRGDIVYYTGQKVSRPELTVTVDSFPAPNMDINSARSSVDRSGHQSTVSVAPGLSSAASSASQFASSATSNSSASSAMFSAAQSAMSSATSTATATATSTATAQSTPSSAAFSAALSNEGNGRENSNHPREEYYQGCLVKKGPRGGKYIIKDGKKKYIYDEGEGQPAGRKGSDTIRTSAHGPVYSLNLLA